MRDVDKLTAEYLRTAASRWACLESGGVEFPLSEVYCMLQAVQTPPPKPLEARNELAQVSARLEHAQLEIEERPEPPKPVVVGEALKDARRLVLLGEPGAGKSTTLQFISLCFATPSMAEDRLGLDGACIPVRLWLRDFAVGLTSLEPGIRLESALAGEVNTLLRLQDVKLAKKLVHTWRDKGQLMALLDGLDEVPELQRTEVRKEIQDFVTSSTGQKCRVVVSSRLAGFAGLGSGFKEYTLKPFESAAEAQPYLAAWLRVLKPDWAGQADEKAGALLEQLEGQPALKRLTDNPLILRLAAEVYAAGEAVPESRADLYRHYLDAAWKRAVERGAQKQEKENVFDTLEKVAWQLQMVEPPVVDEPALHTCREQLGLVVKMDERLIFSHTTFQEYFVALRLMHAWQNNWRWTWQFLKPRLHSTLWHEPMLLLAGLLDDSGHQRLVKKVLNARSPYERPLRRDLRLAAEITAEHKGAAEEIVKAVVNGADRILKFRNSDKNKDIEKEMAIGALEKLGGRQAVKMLTLALKDFDLHVHEKAQKALEKLGGPYAVDLLIQLLEGNNWSARLAAATILGKVGGLRAVEPLIQALKEDSFISKAAAESLGNLGESQAIEPLIQLLELDDYSDTRRQAVKALAKLGGSNIVEPLIWALKDDDIMVRYSAAAALGELGSSQAVKPLIQTLKDNEGLVRSDALKALEKIGGAYTTELLIQVLEDDDFNIRQSAAVALGRIGGKQAVESLIQALKDDSELVRQAAVKGLGELGATKAVNPLIRALKDKDHKVRYDAAEALGVLGSKQAVAPLLQILDDEDENEEVRLASFNAFGKLGGLKAVDPLNEIFVDDEEASQVATTAFENLDTSQKLEMVSQYLNSDEWIFRFLGVAALGQLGLSQSVELLSKALNDNNWVVRGTAVESLRNLGGLLVQEPLSHALEDKDAIIRHDAAYALGKLGEPTAIPSLIHALNDNSVDVRITVVNALRNFDEPQVVEALARAMKDDDDGVRLAVVHSLENIGGSQVVEPLSQALEDDYWIVSLNAVEALGRIGSPKAVKPLIQALNNVVQNVSRAAMEALVKIGGPQVLEPLIQAMKDNDNNENIRQAVAEALGNRGGPREIKRLSLAMKDNFQNIRWAAAEILGNLGGSQVVRPLSQAMKDNNENVRRAAARALEMALSDIVVTSTYLDPFVEPPGEAVKRQWLRVVTFIEVVFLLGLVAVGVTLKDALGDVMKETLKPAMQNFIQTYPWWTAILVVAGIGAVLGLVGWLVDWLKKYFEKQ